MRNPISFVNAKQLNACQNRLGPCVRLEVGTGDGLWIELWFLSRFLDSDERDSVPFSPRSGREKGWACEELSGRSGPNRDRRRSDDQSRRRIRGHGVAPPPRRETAARVVDLPQAGKATRWEARSGRNGRPILPIRDGGCDSGPRSRISAAGLRSAPWRILSSITFASLFFGRAKALTLRNPRL